MSTLHGVQFLLQTQEGLTWMLFASEPIALVYDTIQKTTVTAAEKFSGVLRLALIPPEAGDGADPLNGSAPLSASSGLRRLVYHSHVYPTSGSVSWEFRTGTTQSSTLLTPKSAIGPSSTTSSRTTSNSPFVLGKRPSNRIASLKFHFATKPMNADANSGSTDSDTPLLMLSLPHHTKSLPQNMMLSADKFDLVYQCVKGMMSPVLGDTWAYDVMLNTLGFDDVDITAYAQRLKPSVHDLIMDNVEKDLNTVLPTPDENIYGYGKQVARLAQLTHIAAVMDFSNYLQTNHTSNKTSSDDGPTGSRTFKDAINKLHSSLVEFLDGDVTDYLVYDAKFGGIVSQDGLLDKESDFGNGRYVNVTPCCRSDISDGFSILLSICPTIDTMIITFITGKCTHQGGSKHVYTDSVSRFLLILCLVIFCTLVLSWVT